MHLTNYLYIEYKPELTSADVIDIMTNNTIEDE